jgi:acyl-CoA dehydrogenase
MIDFDPGESLRALQARVRAFVETEVVPREEAVQRDPDSLEQVRRELQAKARSAGIFLPTLPRELGGLGLSWREIAVVLEEAGRSLLGPQALNASAPDEGNMHLLAHVANPAQKERWLLPLARGDIRSAFAMTEPMPGAGSDPDLLRSRAEQRGSSWVLEGEKWFITGAEGAAFFIVLARAPQGPTMFLVDAKTPGLRLLRTIRTLDHLTPGGHGQLLFEGCEVPSEAVLGAPGKGFDLAQFRLVPARLTHCMRWLGVAVRSLEIAARYASERTSFGKKLGEHQSVQNFLADSHIEIEAARLLIWQTAWKLDRGEQPRMESSTAKVFVAETVNRVVDRALQICGALGISEDIPLSTFYKEARPFRIYDGPSEVHRMSIARRVLRRAVSTGSGESRTGSEGRTVR